MLYVSNHVSLAQARTKVVHLHRAEPGDSRSLRGLICVTVGDPSARHIKLPESGEQARVVAHQKKRLICPFLAFVPEFAGSPSCPGRSPDLPKGQERGVSALSLSVGQQK